MKDRIALVVSTIFLVLVPAAKLEAMDVLSATSLAEYCLGDADAAEPRGQTCMAYVRGFVDGAVATDPQVTFNVTRELESAESFTERALRTRVGARIERFGPSVFAEFCIPQPAPLSEITEYVLAALGQLESDGEPAREVVYRTLRDKYPCES